MRCIRQEIRLILFQPKILNIKDLNILSEQLLLAVKTEKSTQSISSDLAGVDSSQLLSLTSEKHKLAFWINCYNAFFLILRKELNLKSPDIYRSNEIVIAGHRLTLDDIEHGILRRYRYKFSLGYLPNLFARKVIKDLAVDRLDYRIHFALNCGAESCPPIAFYNHDKIDKQLDIATESFLYSETSIDHERKKIEVTTLFKWFLGDFGGKKGILRIISKYLNQPTIGYSLIYKPYSWAENLSNWKDV